MSVSRAKAVFVEAKRGRIYVCSEIEQFSPTIRRTPHVTVNFGHLYGAVREFGG